MPNMDPQSVVTLMLQTQYYNTLREIGENGKATSIFVPSAPGAVADTSAQIRDGMMMANAAGSSAGSSRAQK